MKVVVVICMALLCNAVAVGAEEYMGLAWRTTPSPDGAALVYIAEHRVGRDSDYTLTLMTGLDNGVPRVTYSLTPRYRRAVKAPSGEAIAYRATDFTESSPVYVYAPEIAWPHPYPAIPVQAGLRGHVIQWSRDSEYLRLQVLSRSRFVRPIWRTVSVHGRLVPADAPADIEWVEPVEPATLPAFMTQEQPGISRDMPIVWGRDSKDVYVADDEGVWRATIGQPFVPVWRRIYAAAHTQALAMSPSGRCLVVESGDAEERDIHELYLGAGDVDIRSVGAGWGVTFEPTDDRYFYADHMGYYAVNVGEDARLVTGFSYARGGF